MASGNKKSGTKTSSNKKIFQEQDKTDKSKC